MKERFNLREALNNISDFETYLNIKSEREAIVLSGFKKAPVADVFRKVYERIMISENEKLYYLYDREADNRVAASFHLRLIGQNEAEIMGYNVLSQYRGKGVGKMMMQQIIEICHDKGVRKLYSAVAENNIASIKNHEKLGAVATGDFDVRELAAIEQSVKFIHYVFEV